MGHSRSVFTDVSGRVEGPDLPVVAVHALRSNQVDTLQRRGQEIDREWRLVLLI